MLACAVISHTAVGVKFVGKSASADARVTEDAHGMGRLLVVQAVYQKMVENR
jgi:hypothetical protein